VFDGKPKIILTLSPLTWKIWWALNNASRWHMGFNSAFKGLMYFCVKTDWWNKQRRRCHP